MNDIIYAGRIACGEPRKAFEVILSSEDGALEYDGGKLDYNRGDIIVIPPHFSCKRNIGAEDLYVQIDKALIALKQPKVLSDDENAGMAHAVRQAALYFGEERKKDAIIAAFGTLLAGYITAFSNLSGLSPVVESVKADILKNLRDPAYSLEDALKRLPLNYDYVRKLFKRETGVTPHAYLTAERMKLARELLSSGLSNKFSEFTVAQISESCGFSEPLYFSRVFKKYYGVSPSSYKPNV